MASPAWPPADRPGPDAVEARRTLVLAAAAGDLEAATSARTHDDPRVRASALRALHDAGALSDDAVHAGADDPSPQVRRTVAELGATRAEVPLVALLDDPDPTVVETACWAAGERAGPAGRDVRRHASSHNLLRNPRGPRSAERPPWRRSERHRS